MFTYVLYIVGTCQRRHLPSIPDNTKLVKKTSVIAITSKKIPNFAENNRLRSEDAEGLTDCCP